MDTGQWRVTAEIQLIAQETWQLQINFRTTNELTLQRYWSRKKKPIATLEFNEFDSASKFFIKSRSLQKAHTKTKIHCYATIYSPEMLYRNHKLLVDSEILVQ